MAVLFWSQLIFPPFFFFYLKMHSKFLGWRENNIINITKWYSFKRIEFISFTLLMKKNFHKLYVEINRL